VQIPFYLQNVWLYRHTEKLVVKELRIVIADDSEIIRDKLRLLFSKVQGVALVGMAADGLEAIRMIKALDPEVVVLDISMPHKSGLEVLREIRSENSSRVVVTFTADSSSYIRRACLEAGANHHLDKSDFGSLEQICRQQLQSDCGQDN
jgi:DNA-binding NarL/FixJ family response regulator